MAQRFKQNRLCELNGYFIYVMLLVVCSGAGKRYV